MSERIVCSLEDHLTRNCPKNQNLKQLKFEKRQRKDEKRKIIVQAEESDKN